MIFSYGYRLTSAQEALQNHAMDHNAGTASRDLNDKIALEIQIELLRRGWSQADLAERMGKTEMWVSRRIKVKGERQQMTVNEVPLFADALGLNILELMGKAHGASIPWKTRATAKRASAVVRTIAPPAVDHLTGRVAGPNGRPTPSKADRVAEAGPRRLYRVGQ